MGSEFSPSEAEGTSRKIVKNNIDTLKEHLENQQHKHEMLTKFQVQTGEMLSIEEILKRLRLISFLIWKQI